METFTHVGILTGLLGTLCEPIGSCNYISVRSDWPLSISFFKNKGSSLKRMRSAAVVINA